MQNNYPFDLSQLWEATEFGLKYWHEVYTDSIGLENKNKHFKTHTEQSASTILSNKKNKNGIYSIYNFSCKEGLTPIDHVKKERSYNFIEACDFLFQKYNLTKSNTHSFKPETSFTDTDKEPGYWNVEYLKEVSNHKSIFPFATENQFNDFGFFSVASYEKSFTSSKTNKPTLLKVVATEAYPIFGYKNKSFAKMYEPKASKDDKYSLKHHFLGTKPKRHIYGWDLLFDKVDVTELERLYHRLRNEKDIPKFVCGDDWSIEDTSHKSTNDIINQINEVKVDEVFIATGGSDGINLASLGYNVIWFNSEAEILSTTEYWELNKIAKTIYYVPDLDATGIKQAVKLGLKFTKIKILWLPEELKKENKKDFADWIRKNKNLEQSKVRNMFEKLKTLALEFKFWDAGDKAVKINPKKMLHFLYHNHFRLYKQPHKVADNGKEDDGYFIQVENNIIKKSFPSEIRRFVNNWLDANYLNINIYNMVIRSNFFNPNTLKALPYFDYQKNHAGLNHQYYFFNNKPVLVTPVKIEMLEYSESLGVSVWEENVINHFYTPLQPFFATSKDDLGRLRIKIENNESMYFKVLINTSRIFWKKDADLTGKDKMPFSINSTNLSVDENYLQELHLLNKMYCVGYLLHQYKSISKAFMVLGMDYEGGKSVKGSYGGTGKSFLQKALFNLLNSESKAGKTLKNDNFPMDGITPKTQFALFDDLDAYQSFEFFYNMITDNMVANQKGGVIYNMPFDDSPKVGATTNFAPYDLSPSTRRRLLVIII